MKSHVRKVEVKESSLYNGTVKGIMINVEDKKEKFVQEVEVPLLGLYPNLKKLLRTENVGCGTIKVQGKEYYFAGDIDAVDASIKPVSYVHCNKGDEAESALFGNFIIFNKGTSFPFMNTNAKDMERVENSYGLHFWEDKNEGPFLVIHG